MKKEKKPNEPEQQDVLPPAVQREAGNISQKPDEGEHFEINILGIVKVKSRRVNYEVIIAILVVLVFIWMMIKF